MFSHASRRGQPAIEAPRRLRPSQEVGDEGAVGLASFWARASDALDALGAPTEAVFVDDGSRDGTFAVLAAWPNASSTPGTLRSVSSNCSLTSAARTPILSTRAVRFVSFCMK